MSDKPFLTYKQQLDKLKNKNVTWSDNFLIEESLRSHSYYGIINGYKDIFGTYFDEELQMEIFKTKTPFTKLHRLALIDNSLNNLLFKYIIYIEKSLKTKIAYVVAREYGEHEEDYLKSSNYVSTSTLSRLSEMNNIRQQIKNNKNSASLQHYKNNHDCIPPWIATGGIYFGTAINWYKILKGELKSEIAQEFFFLTNLTDTDKQKELLIVMLNLLQEYRNNIAHGNRTFQSNVRTELTKNHLLEAVDKRVLTESEFLSGIGKKDLFAVMISIAILINDSLLLDQYIFDLENLIMPYVRTKQQLSPRGDIFKTLNIPENVIGRLLNILSIKIK